jgi:hypothetical protein
MSGCRRLVIVDRKVDLIVSSGGDLAARAAKNATSMIPIGPTSARTRWPPDSLLASRGDVPRLHESRFKSRFHKARM